jgi:uncharacterized membrane protein YfcA
MMTTEFWLFVAAGFVAQLIDGALGMAYGVTASSLLLAFGVPPAAASATVHAAECFTTGASAVSHHVFDNIDRALFKRLLIPAIGRRRSSALTSSPACRAKRSSPGSPPTFS